MTEPTKSAENSFGFHQVEFLKRRSGRDYEDFGFDDEYFGELLALMGADPGATDRGALELAHFSALSGFLQAERVERRWTSIGDESEALSKVQTLAQTLSAALTELQFKGQAGKRLHTEISAIKNVQFNHNGTTLSDLLGESEFEPFGGVADLLFDLQVGLERAKIQKPKPLEALRLQGDLATQRQQNDTYWVRRIAAKDIEEAPEERYRRLTRDHALTPNPALVVFVSEFEEMWHAFASVPFTEGRYEKDARQNISRTVDAAELFLRKIGATYPRSLITRKVREVREVRYEMS